MSQSHCRLRKWCWLNSLCRFQTSFYITVTESFIMKLFYGCSVFVTFKVDFSIYLVWVYFLLHVIYCCETKLTRLKRRCRFNVLKYKRTMLLSLENGFKYQLVIESTSPDVSNNLSQVVREKGLQQMKFFSLCLSIILVTLYIPSFQLLKYANYFLTFNLSLKSKRRLTLWHVCWQLHVFMTIIWELSYLI